jgi:hypothetical protein
MQIVHLGIRKTGTSTFQQTIRRAAEDQEDLLNGKPEVARWARDNRHNNKERKPDFSALEAILRAGVDCHAVFSHEGLAFYDQAMLAETIAKTLPQAKILLTVRAPNSFLRSEFRYMTRDGRVLDVDVFSKHYTRNMLLKLLDIRRYTDAFEAVGLGEQFTILPFELQGDSHDNYLDLMTTYTGVDFHKYRPPYHVKKSPDRRFTELNRRLNEMIGKDAPAILKSAEYMRFVNMASIASAQLPNFEENFGHFYEGLSLDTREPEVPAEFWPDLQERLEPLRDLKAFEPYLNEYGLATEQKEPH